MTKVSIDSQAIAGDIYPRWKKLVRQAQYSIAVYAPYLDNTIIKLLGNKPESIPFESLTVIIGFDPEYMIVGITH